MQRKPPAHRLAGVEPPLEAQTIGLLCFSMFFSCNRIYIENNGKSTSWPKRGDLDIPDSEKICPESGEPLVCIGHEISRKLGRTPEHKCKVERSMPVVRQQMVAGRSYN